MGSELGDPKSLTIYLNSPMREDAVAGKVNIINRIENAFRPQGFETTILDSTEENVVNSANDPGYSLFFMEEPFHPRALTLRRAYFYPFWRIENSAKRWKWEAAETDFRPGRVDGGRAQKFMREWRKRLYGDVTAFESDGDFVFVPLQGRLLERRSFQSASPIKMVEATLRHNSGRTVHATLHPKLDYSGEEIQALDDLVKKYPQLIVSTTDARKLIGGCKYVVTQNSAVVLDGYFHQKPAVLFGKIDFHHISANTYEIGAEGAFSTVESLKPPFSRYLFWFLQEMSINAGRPTAEDQILETVRKRGWDI